MKRIFAAILVMVLLISALPCGVSAAADTQVIALEDGSYVVVSVEKSSARAANTVTGSKNYTYYDSNNNLQWKAKLTATFAYSGGWYTCTTANCNVTITNTTNWYVVSNNTIRSSNNAVTNLTMGRKALGVTVEKYPYTITLTCDNNGNLS